MQNKILKLFFLSMIFFALPHFSRAAVIFEDNFDAQADWQPKPAGLADDAFPGSTVAHDYADSTDPYNTPANWSFFRSTGIWYGPTYQETIRITNQAGHGTGSSDGAGKSFIVYNEAHIGTSGDGWGADGLLTKHFNQDYPELYARVWLKTQPGWKWAINNDMLIKMFRIKHFDKAGSIFAGFPAGTLAPIYLWDIKHSNTWGTRWTNALRCDPQETDYYCVTSPPADHLFVAGDINIEPNAPGMPADATWHRLDFHVKMNTYNSGTSSWNADGTYEFSYDGVLGESFNNIAWKRSGSDEAIGWNTFDLGGNAFNNYNNEWVTNNVYNVDETIVQNSYTWKALQTHTSSGESYPTFTSTAYWQNMGLIAGQKEQWYALDDVVVSTTAIPANYTIGAADVLAPSAPTGLGVI